ncbi:hypothetical protein M4578_14115 [Salipiger sp. P9]|uniref:hypothetical protein n=1 Tax=Salipiger pentaromativorans TaxID=2943193 RepID=UPI0021579117|nr:hypothetical protein [Salipiger pentaromativorans]MCR8548969.1 hypothetical protein [Salipiger pentaromativorans]
MAQETWPGIVVRCTTSEDGTTPRSASSNSPDILISGTTPYEDPAFLEDPANYGQSYPNSLYIGLPNYLYVRGKNYTDATLEGNWNLFFAEPNILLYPYLWEQNQLATSAGDKNPPFTIEAGAIGASTDPFTWVPPNVSDHYCLVAVAATPDHGNPVSGVNNINSLAEVMSNNANIAQRNVQMIRGNVPQVVSQARYDQGSEGATVDLAVVFSNIPKGSSYTISSGTPLDGMALSHSDSNTQDNNFKYAWTDLEIPAQWVTMFNYTLTFGSDWSGIPPDAIPSVEIRGELVQEDGDPLYHLGVDATDPATGRTRMSSRGGPVRLVTVGSVKTIMPDVEPS